MQCVDLLQLLSPHVCDLCETNKQDQVSFKRQMPSSHSAKHTVEQ